MEAFDIGLFPGCSGLDISASDPLALEPVLNRLGNELWSIVAAQVLRRAITLDRCLQHRDRINGPDRVASGDWLHRVSEEDRTQGNFRDGAHSGILGEELPGRGSHKIVRTQFVEY